MDSVRKQRDTKTLRVAGVKAAGQTPVSIILSMGSISCSPESTEDECNGVVQGDSTLVKLYLGNNDCLETEQGDVGGEDKRILKTRGNCRISNHQEMLKGKDQTEGKVWEGYCVHGNENVLTVDQKVVKLHDECPTAILAQTEERPTTVVAQTDERPTAIVAQTDERPTTVVAQSEKRQALSLDVEVKIDVKSQSQSTKNKFQLTMKENVNILPDPKTGPEGILDVALGRKSSSRFSPKSNRSAKQLLAFWLVMSVFSSVAATQLKPPGQELPRECFDLLETHGNDCPQYGDPFFETGYTSLNETCCAGYPYLDFHCQMGYQKSGEQFSRMACLRTEEVPENHYGRIMGYNTSRPYFKVEKLNDTHVKNTPARKSWQVTKPYHPHAKNECKGLGQQLLCRGVEDNLCTCQDGFYPVGKGCQSGFGAEDACVCQHCPVGTHAARNFSKPIGGSCDDLSSDFTAEFSCKENPTPASSISSTTQSTFAGSSTTSHPLSTTKAGGDDDRKKDSKTTMIVLAVVCPLIGLVLIIVLGIIFWAILKAKLSSVCSCGNVFVNFLKRYTGRCSGGSSEPVDDSPGSLFLAPGSSESVV